MQGCANCDAGAISCENSLGEPGAAGLPPPTGRARRAAQGRPCRWSPALDGVAIIGVITAGLVARGEQAYVNELATRGLLIVVIAMEYGVSRFNAARLTRLAGAAPGQRRPCPGCPWMIV